MPADSVDARYAVEQLVGRQLAGVESISIGVIEKFDHKEGAEVRKLVSLVRRDEEGAEVEEKHPVIVGVPVQFPRTRKAGVSFPIEPGEPCLLLFCKESLEEWLVNGGDVKGDEGRRHGMSSPVAVVGVFDFGHPGPMPPIEGISVYVVDGLSVHVKKTSVEVGGADKFVAMAEPVSQQFAALKADLDLVKTHTHPVAGAVASVSVQLAGMTNPAPPTIASSKVKVGA